MWGCERRGVTVILPLPLRGGGRGRGAYIRWAAQRRTPHPPPSRGGGAWLAAYNLASIRSHIVRSTITRAKYLSFAGTSTQGANTVLVRSIMSHTARSYNGAFSRLRQSSAVSLKLLNGDVSRALNLANCSSGVMVSQNFTTM